MTYRFNRIQVNKILISLIRNLDDLDTQELITEFNSISHSMQNSGQKYIYVVGQNNIYE